ncbi:MAG TPA: hypothetical protein VF245_08600 [Solirubrobacterales bacterium]
MQVGTRGRLDAIEVAKLAAALFAAVLILALAPNAQAATFEQVETFGEGPEIQLGGVSDMAINVDGSGEVTPGTVYTVGVTGGVGGGVRVARFSPGGQFELAWEISETEGIPNRCGNIASLSPCTAHPSATVGRAGIGIDQLTGAVYVLNTRVALGQPTVSVYKPDGSEELSTRFAVRASESETAADFPARIHQALYPGGLAVNSAGEVFLFDVNFGDHFYHRVMVFEPETPGSIKHYVYAGQGQDIATGTTGNFPSDPTIDAAGDLYVAGYQSDYIEKYDPSQPSAPVCTFTLKGGGITGFAVNTKSGEIFYYTYKDKHIHQLSPCAGGTFTPSGQAISVSPERDELYGMAVNPDLELLYGVAPSETPQTGVGKGEPGKTALGYIFAPIEEKTPVVEAESVLRTSETTAKLQATINPKGFQTRYVFEYLTRTAYEEGGGSFNGASEAPPGGALAGNSQGSVSVVGVLSGLTPGREYVYRVVVETHCAPSEPGKVCDDKGQAESFSTAQVGASLQSDGRLYELVSPVEKNSGQVLPADPRTKSCPKVECKPGDGYTHFPMQSAPDGNGVVYEGSAFVPGEGALIENQYIARRSESGWQSVNLTPSQLFSKRGQGYKFFDVSLSQGLLEQGEPSLVPEAPTDFTNLYRQSTDTPAQLRPLLTSSNSFIHRLPTNGLESLNLTFVGASADVSRIFFEANDALTSEAGEAGEKTNLYEWSGGVLTQVNLAPGSEVPAPGAALGSGKLLKSGNPAVTVFTHAVSSDGSRVFWTGEDGGTYARLDGLGTLEVPGPGSCKESVALALRACFLTASEDGSSVLLSNGQIYEFNEEAASYEAGPDLTSGAGGFLGIAGQSEDLSHVYFVDTAVLTGEEENDQGAKAQAGKDNLYAWIEGSTTFVGTLLAADNIEIGAWQASPAVRTAEASPGGRYVTFLSQAPLTGYDNTGPCNVVSGTEEFKSGPCAEVFLYDSATDELVCPSCNPGNAVPLGPSVLRTILGARGSLPQPRYLTDSGRLYFDSQDALVPADTNGRAEDVYQYEPQGIGSCTREAGCVSLISGGRAATDSNLLAIDASGDNVFFTTRDRLVPADKDELIDLYDARVEGGFPEASGSSGGCQAEACQPAVLPPPKGSPTSQSFTGTGNVRCNKGKVMRRGRCVKKPRRARHNNKTKRASKARGGAK